MREFKPHEARVIKEHDDLTENCHKLEDFIKVSPVFPTLDPIDQSLLSKQLVAMRLYQEILQQRINRFTA